MHEHPRGNVLVDRQLKELAEKGHIKIGQHLDRIQPASIDLVVKKGKICEVAGIPNLNRDFSYHTFVDRYALNCFNPTDGDVTLGCNRVYVAEIDLDLALPKGIFGHANPKSSIGRIDAHCTIIAEGAREFNFIPEGYEGPLYMLIVPQSFPIQIRPGDSLCQLRLFSERRDFIQDTALKDLNEEIGLVLGGRPAFLQEGVILHLDLQCSPSNLVANRAGRPIDLSLRGTLNPAAFFREKLLDDHGNLFLEPGEFVLASTIEKLSIPDYLCGEMVAFDERWGEIRTHYAGFFDPGFGRGRRKEISGSSVVCEIRNIGMAPVILSHHQPICMMQFEYVSEVPEQVYGETSAVEASNYQGQESLRLAKYFKAWEN